MTTSVEIANSKPTAKDRTHRLLVVSGSASKTSRSERLGDYIRSMLKGNYVSVEHLRIRELPMPALACADMSNCDVAKAVQKLDDATAIIFITPTYKGSYSGLLKMFIDVLPQYALRGKTVLPLATGGTIAHMQMLDHALRPVLQTMWPRHVAQGTFVLDRLIEIGTDGAARLVESEIPLLNEVVSAFEAMVSEAAL